MSKIVLRLRFNDYWKIGEHESWFTDMAKKGLHLKKMGLLFAHFEKGEPTDMKYRIDIANGQLTLDQLNLYKECGWDYVTVYGKFRVFASPEERNAPELHTEPGEQSYTLQAFDKELRLSTTLVGIAVAFIFLILPATMFINRTPVLNMVEGDFLQQLLLLIVEGYVLFTSLQAWLSIRSIRKRLLEGKPIDHHADWRKARRRNNAARFLILLLSIAVILPPIISLTKDKTAPLPENSASLPFIRLLEIEEDPGLILGMEGRGQQERELDRYIKSWSTLAPVQLESDEYGFVPGRLWDDESGTYSPSIHMKYYKLRFPVLADSLLHDLIKYNFNEKDAIKRLKERNSSFFDKLYVLKDPDGAEIFASLGNRVIYVRYYGYADIEKLLTLTRRSVE